VYPDLLLLGVDGGGTRCRARLSTFSGHILGESETGPANLRLGLDRSFSAVMEAATQCLDRAQLAPQNQSRIVACLALAGASEPSHLKAAEAKRHPFRTALITTDAHAACVGAHGASDGGVIVAGTGTVGWAVLKGRSHRVGGWGLPISDEGSGAWLGCEALRRTIWAYDGRIDWTDLLRLLFAEFGSDAHALVDWVATASPGDFGSLVPHIVDQAEREDPTAVELLGTAAAHIDALATQLIAIGAIRLALVGGLAPFLRSRLKEATRSHLVEPAGDPIHGALVLARRSAELLLQPESSIAPTVER
jgi:glucosamine kinase